MRVISILSLFAIKNWSAKVRKNQTVLVLFLNFWACPAAFSVRPMALPQKAAGQAFRCKPERDIKIEIRKYLNG
jgi:hypothetical protein